MGLPERGNVPAGMFRGKDTELTLAGGQAACSEAVLAELPSPCSASAVQCLLLERLGLAWSRRSKDIFFHGERKKNHMVATSLCYRTQMRSGATVGYPGAWGWWQPREGIQGWAGSRHVGAGPGHAMVSTHLLALAPTSPEVRGCSLRGVSRGVYSREWGQQPLSLYHGESHRKDSNKAQTGGDGGLRAMAHRKGQL